MYAIYCYRYLNLFNYINIIITSFKKKENNLSYDYQK